MDEFHRDCALDHVVGDLGAQGGGRRQHQGGAQPLAARRHQVPRHLGEKRVLGSHGRGQGPFDTRQVQVDAG